MHDDMENLSRETGDSPPGDLLLPPSSRPLAPRDIWTPRDLLLFVAFIPFALLAANLIVLMGYTVLRPFMRWHARVESLGHNTFFVLILQCLIYLFVLAYLVLLARIVHHRQFWKSLGWRKPTPSRVVLLVVAGAVLAVLISLAPPLLPDTQTFPLEQLFTSPAASYALGVFAIGIAPVVEELVFRGLLFAVFERAAGLTFAIAGTATLFAALHIQEYWHAWNHLLMIFVVGAVFSVARGKSGSLTPSVFLHVGYNACMMGSLFISTQHFHTLNLIFAR